MKNSNKLSASCGDDSVVWTKDDDARLNLALDKTFGTKLYSILDHPQRLAEIEAKYGITQVDLEETIKDLEEDSTSSLANFNYLTNSSIEVLPELSEVIDESHKFKYVRTWESLKQELHELKYLDHDWDGHEGLPIGETLIHVMSLIVSTLIKSTLPVPKITPLGNGNLKLYWKLPDIYGCLEVSDTEYVGYIEDKSEIVFSFNGLIDDLLRS